MFISCAISFMAFMVSAQENNGELRIMAKPAYVHGDDIAVSGSYTPYDASYPEITEHTWELIPCDDADRPNGAPVLTTVVAGSPGEFSFTNTGSIEPDQKYLVSLTVTDKKGNRQTGTSFPPIAVLTLDLMVDPYYCCFSSISVGAMYLYSLPIISWEYEITKTTQDGIPLGTTFQTGSLGNAPIPYTFPTSVTNPICSQFAKIKLIAVVGTSPQTTLTSTKIVSVDNTPVFTNSSYRYGTGQLEFNFCGNPAPGGTVCLDLHPGEVVNSWYSGYTLVQTGGTCLTITPNMNNNMLYVYADRTPCVTGGIRSGPVHLVNNDPSFQVLTSVSGGTYSVITYPNATPTLPATASVDWTVVQTGCTAPYSPIGTPTTWSTNTVSNPYTLPYTFNTGSCYRVTRKISCPQCTSSTTSSVVNQNGVVCSNCYVKPDQPLTDRNKLSADMPVEKVSEMSTAVMEAEDAAFAAMMSVSPNPGNGLFTLTSNAGENGTIEVYDALGHKVYAADMSDTRGMYPIDLSSHPKGIYLMNVKADNGKKAVKKLLIE